MRGSGTTREAGIVRQRVWDLAQRRRGPDTPWASQSGQDHWLELHVFRGLRYGRFLDLGGYDGVTGSNTLFFERERKWTGLLVEPVPSVYEQARRARGCSCVCAAVGAEEGTADFRTVVEGRRQTSGLVSSFHPRVLEWIREDPRHVEEIIEVPVVTATRLLGEHGIDRLDYVSLDVEGSETSVLAGFPLDSVRVTAWTIENLTRTTEVQEVLEPHGYELVAKIGLDDVYLDLT